MPVDISVIVVGMDSLPFMRPCLGSLNNVDWRGYSYGVIYVDNASTDGSVDVIRQEFPSVQLIVNEENAGFCRACNQGAAAAESRYLYLLNVDAVAFPHSVVPLAEFLDGTPKAGAAANRLLNPDLTDQWSARRFPTWYNALFGRRTWLGRLFPSSKVVNDYLYKDCFAQQDAFRVDWVPGSCSLVRRTAFEQLRGLPEDMHYWSDAVFCDRLGRAGWDVYVVPTATLIHFESQGTGGKNSALRHWLITDFHRGAYLFYCEHYRLGRWSPTRVLAKSGLGLRAQTLIAVDRFTTRQ